MKIFCTQIVPNAIKKIPTKPINTGFVGVYLFIQTLGRRDLSGCFPVHICAFYSSYSSYFAFYVPRLKFLEPKWSHHNSSKIVETFFFLLIFLSSYFSTICIANSI